MRAMQALQPQIKELQGEIQKRQTAHAAGNDALLQREQSQPVRLLHPLIAQLPVFITLSTPPPRAPAEHGMPERRALRAYGADSSSSTTREGDGRELIVCWSSTSAPSSPRLLHVGDCRQNPAADDVRPAAGLRPFILTFPAGLILYWITTNFWTIGQGLVMKR